MDVAKQVVAATQARAAALVAGDADRLGELLHDQFRWTTHRGETFDRSEYIRRNTEGHTVWRSQEVIGPEVVVVGDAAVLRAEVADEVVSGGNDVEAFRMPLTLVWVRTAMGWKCLAGHAGPRRP